MRRFVFLLCISAFTFLAKSQTYKEIGSSVNFFIGASNMMGDLGGSDFVGNRGIFDLDVRATRPAFGLGGALHMGSFSLDASVLYTWLAGSDEYSGQDFQTARNLHVRTNLFEGDLVLVYRPLSRSYNMSRLYFYAGIGGIHYQPKAKYQDEWVKLRPLGTEGQNHNGDGQYSEWDYVIPYGIGYKFRLTKSTSLVLDLGFRKTFNDYLDDVSTVYEDPASLLASSGQVSVDLADRSETGMEIGSIRGNPEVDDMYFILGLKFEKILGGNSGDGCYYNRNPPKTRSTRINQRRMFTR